MASQEADGAELRAARAGEAPGRPGEAAAGGRSADPRSQNHPEVLQVLGAVQILNGAVILALGGFMHSVQNLSHPPSYFFFSVVYTGYSTWGAIFFLVSGILSLLAGKKPTKTLLESSLGMHSASASVAVVGIVYLSMNLFANDPLLKDCQSSQPPALCIYMEASSNGLISLMLVLTLLELCIACSVIALWLKANCCHLRKLQSLHGDLEGFLTAAFLCELRSASEIELAEVSLQESVLLEKPAPTVPRQTWLTVLKRELEFLGVTQILIGLIYLYFGIIVSSKINDSEFTEYFFSSFKAGYPFWGALFFAISGILSIMSERKPSAYLIRGCLGANAVSSVAAGTGVGVLISNLKQSSTYVYRCKEVYENDYCSLACFSTEVVAIILLLTILGFGSAVSLIAYGIGEMIEGSQIPEDRLYEEVNIYSPIYSELEEREETASPADS